MQVFRKHIARLQVRGFTALCAYCRRDTLNLVAKMRAAVLQVIVRQMFCEPKDVASAPQTVRPTLSTLDPIARGLMFSHSGLGCTKDPSEATVFVASHMAGRTA